MHSARGGGAGLRDARSDSATSIASEAHSAGRLRAHNERASPALYWLTDAALAQQAPQLRSTAPPSRGNAARAAPPAWDHAPANKPARVSSSSKPASPPRRQPSPRQVRRPRSAAEFIPHPSLRSGGGGGGSRASYFDDAYDYGADWSHAAPSVRAAGAAAEEGGRLGGMIEDNLALLRELTGHGAGDASALGAFAHTNAAPHNAPPQARYSHVAPPPRTPAAAPQQDSGLGVGGWRDGAAHAAWAASASASAPPHSRESYGGGAYGVASLPWPPQPPPRVSDTWAGFVRPSPQQHAQAQQAQQAHWHANDDAASEHEPQAQQQQPVFATASLGDLVSPARDVTAALRVRLEAQGRELAAAQRRAADAEAALAAAHAGAAAVSAARGASNGAAAAPRGDADASHGSSTTLAALLRRVEDAEARAAAAGDEAAARAADAEARAADAEAALDATIADADAAERRAEAATATAAAAVAAATERAGAAEARAAAAESDLADLRRAAADAEQALAVDRDASAQLSAQLSALQAWSRETAAELRELRAAAGGLAATAATAGAAAAAHGELDALLADAESKTPKAGGRGSPARGGASGPSSPRAAEEAALLGQLRDLTRALDAGQPNTRALAMLRSALDTAAQQPAPAAADARRTFAHAY
jgi:hypothetical protein